MQVVPFCHRALIDTVTDITHAEAIFKLLVPKKVKWLQRKTVNITERSITYMDEEIPCVCGLEALMLCRSVVHNLWVMTQMFTL